MVQNKPSRQHPGDSAGLYERIYAVVRRIPSGRVATYGQIARLAGIPRHARQVGYALHALPAQSGVPWHRVINARGEISLRREGGADVTQRLRLEREGICLVGGRISLHDYQWSDTGEGGTPDSVKAHESAID